MTVLEHAPQGELSDAELISAVRGGDVSAYGDLFARHREAATRLARQLVPSSDADDLVSEAFAKVLNVLLAGGGPDVAFRAYLLTAVRRLHVDKIRATNRAMPTDDLTPYDQGEPFNDTVLAGFEGGAAARAYASLPERWQLVLWHLEVEGQKPAEVAPLLGMTPNSVSALAYRAREGLRQAYLQMHSADIADADCRWTHEKLGAYVRKGLSRRDAAKVEEHLRTCRKCTALFLELSEVNSSMAGVIGPVVLGTATMGYLGAAAPAGLWGGVWGGLIAAFGSTKEALAANAKVAIGVGAAAGVAGIATVAVLVANNSGGTQAPPQVEPTPGISTPVTQPPSTPQPPKPTRTPSTTPQQQNTGGSTTPVVFHPSPAPSSSPSKTPTKTPSTPPSTPPTTPPTTPPVTPTSADVSVDLAFQAKLGLLGAKNAGTIGNLTATTDGVPTGMTGSITIKTLGATLEQIGSGCTVQADTTTCPIWEGMHPLVFKMIGVPVTTSATVVGPTNVSDPAPRNNHAGLLLGLLG
ncbi:MAG: sigma-70 family RNA polymerase sigma factor [Marmoricola sp.]